MTNKEQMSLIPFSGALGIATISTIGVLFFAVSNREEIAMDVMRALQSSDVEEALKQSDPSLRVILPPTSSHFQSAVDTIIAVVRRGTDQQKDDFIADPSR